MIECNHPVVDCLDAKMKKLEAIVEAARSHVRYAKEKRDCGPCFEYCPNAINGDSSCECGGSSLWSTLKALDRDTGKEE